MNTQSQTVLGIDPGYGIVGYGIIRNNAGEMIPIRYGCIRTYPKDGEHMKRLQKIFLEMNSLIEQYTPDCIAIEELFFARNTTTALKVSEARGVILLSASLHNLPVCEYTPNQVKLSVTGSGRADKRQMQEMIQRLLALDELPRPDDAADALSLAVCHLQYRREIR